MPRPKNDQASAKGLESQISFRETFGKDAIKERVLKRAEEEMRFVSLHHHSTYSYLDGYGHPKDHVDRVWELGMNAMALTEHGNVSSHVKLEKAGKDRGIKPIFGCEMYAGGLEKTQSKNHLTVLAETQHGYRNLMEVVTWAWGEGFYYKPSINGRILAEKKEGLIVLSGCLGSLLVTSLIGGKNIPVEEASFERGLKVARWFHKTFGDSYFIEVQTFPQLPDTCRVNPMLEEIGSTLDIPLVATSDVHYPRKEDRDIQHILHSVRPDMKKSVEDRSQAWEEETDLSPPRSDLKVWEALKRTGLSRHACSEAIDSTIEIAKRCNVELPKADPLRFPLPDGYRQNGIDQTQHYWRDQLREGWAFRRVSEKEDVARYVERLRYEVSIIEQKEFIDYFLIVGDMIRWAKDEGIFIGPARGSAAASLVCYLLRITEVDPMIFPDLIFERFIDLTRQDLPDIDFDSDDRRRHEMFEYLQRKYGTEQVSTLCSFTTYKSKLALDDVAKVHHIPINEVEAVKELLIERSSGDLRASATILDTVESFDEAGRVFKKYPELYHSTRLEGMVKGMGRHAAGYIVASHPLTDICAVYGETTAVDKYDAEELGLLKIDALGLSTCGMLSEAMDLLGHDIEFLYNISLEDEETIKGFQEGDLTGIFQFDGRAMRLVNNVIIPDRFYEVCVVNALARPGPLNSLSHMHYANAKFGRAQIEESHPLFDAIVAHTYGQVIYQEQVLRIVREIGNFDWTAAAYIRKIISRKIGEQEFNRQWGKFINGARSNGVNEDMAKKIWGLCITSGSYAFNAAHSVSYGMLGWWTMWLKRHHPEVFYLANLRRLPEKKHLELLRDAVRHDINIKSPDIINSGVGWDINSDGIQAGFSQIPKIGPAQAEKVVEYRKENDLAVWSDLINVKGIGPKTMEVINEFVNQSDPLGVHVIEKKLKAVLRSIKSGKMRGNNGRRLPIPTHTSLQIPNVTEQDLEVVWIGVLYGRNLRDLFELNISRTGIPLNPNEVKNPELRESMLLYGTDDTDAITMKIDRWRYPRFREAVWKIKLGRDIVLVKGVKKGSIPMKLIYVSELVVIE